MANSKKIVKILTISVGLGIFLTLLILNINNYLDTSKRFLQIFDIKNLKTYFDNYVTKSNGVYCEVANKIEVASDKINYFFTNLRFDKETILYILITIINVIYSSFLYFINIGLNILIIMLIVIRESIYGVNEKIKTSPLAKLYITIRKFIHFLITRLIIAIRKLKKIVSKNRRKIAYILLMYSISTGFLYTILVEIIIFFIVYIYHAIRLETYVVLESLFKSLLLIIYPIGKKIPRSILYILLYFLIFKRAITRASQRLKKNHQRLKRFAKDELTQTTFINGAPGTGKTLLNISLSLASEENYIEELEEKLINYEAKYRYQNFALIRHNSKEYPEHDEYYNIIKTLRERGTYLISNYAIYSPYFKQYSKVFDFDFMRKNIKTNIYPLEEYIVISLSEIDKEYNSHDDMKAVGIDGAHTFFSTVSHDLKRNCKIFADYQLKDQVPLRIRGNAEYFIKITKREKKYPLLLGLYYFPFKVIWKLTVFLIRKYELKKKQIGKDTTRTSLGEYKKNNVNFLYIILRQFHSTLSKICNWFEKYSYFRLHTLISQEGEDKAIKKKININICDLEIEKQKLYDSTFLSFAYEQKKNKDFKDLESFTKLTPSIEELEKCHSKFYNKINS